MVGAPRTTDKRRLTVPRDLPDWLISHGRHWITTDEIAATLAIAVEQVPPIVARLRRAGRMFSPTRGGYVPIPAEYRSWRAVPASHFIDSMMRYLGHEYYVGYLSAAEVHGAAHQRPQVFQVITDARLNDRSFDRVTITAPTTYPAYPDPSRPAGWADVPAVILAADLRLSGRIVMLPQQPQLFPGTIHDNLGLARPAASADELSAFRPGTWPWRLAPAPPPRPQLCRRPRAQRRRPAHRLARPDAPQGPRHRHP